MWAQKWQPWHAKHVTSLLITCLGPCKQKIACGHAPPLVFFQKVMPQQQRMHSTKQTATTQEMQTRCWKQQAGPLKSDEQGDGGKKKSRSPFFSLFKNHCCHKKWRLQKCGRHTCHFFSVQMTPSGPHCPCQWTHKRVWCHLGCVGHNNFISRSADGPSLSSAKQAISR